MPIVLESTADASVGTVSARERALVNRLRVLLRDGPDVQMRSLNTLVEARRGRRWTDEVLLVNLQQSIGYINGVPPFQSYTLDDVPEAWDGVVCMGGMVFALFGESIVQNGEAFSYADNGISLSINTAAGYSGIAGTLMSAWSAQVTNMKKAIRPFGASIKSSPLPVRIRNFAPRQWVYR